MPIRDDDDWSPAALWEDFDPRAEDLNIQILSDQVQAGVTVRELRYLSHCCDGEPIEVYAFLAIPKRRSKVPAVLHIHGGGQTASPQHVLHWARKGYAALSFDWTGPAEGREKVTQFGNASTSNYLVEPSPQFSHLYHGTAIARRGLTLLEQQPEVNSRRFGIYGISWGGFLCWLVNGSDPRVKAAVAIYGCGGTLKWGNRTGWNFDTEDEQQRHWNFCFSPFSYAELQHGPMLFLNGTNDFFGWMDTAEELFTLLPARHSLCFSPHFDHHLDDATSRGLYAWMSTHLKQGKPWPKPVKLSLQPGQDWVVTVSAHEPSEVESVEVFCAEHAQPPPSRFWCPLNVRKRGNVWQADAPIRFPEFPHTVYATVHYRRGISISSIPKTFSPLEHGAYEEEQEFPPGIDDFSEGVGHWFLAGLGTEPFPEALKLRMTTNARGESALTIKPVPVSGPTFGWNLATRKTGNPHWAANGRSLLLLRLNVSCLGPLTIRLTFRPGMSDAEAFTARIENPQPGWQELDLAPEKFKNPEGLSPENFERFALLEISGVSPVDSPPMLARVAWM